MVKQNKQVSTGNKSKKSFKGLECMDESKRESSRSSELNPYIEIAELKVERQFNG